MNSAPQTNHVPATRTAALERLHAFLPSAGRAYAAKRNYDFGPDRRDNISMLSPYVRYRLITEQEIVAAVLSAHSLSTAEKFIQEVCWRTYWKGWLEQRPDVWSAYRSAVVGLQTSGLSAAIDRAERGATGIDAFDAWSRELRDTGYLHNHARMWFASIWIFTLHLPWQSGADFFLRHLLDGDAASNTLSWRWVAGLHTLGKTYLARMTNIDTYTDGRFQPLGLATVAPPLAPDGPFTRKPLLNLPSTPARPREPMTLLLTEDDLGIESMDLPAGSIARICLIDTASADPAISDQVIAFKRQALADAAARAEARFSCPVDTTAVTDVASTVVRHGLPAVMHEAPVGPVRDLLQAELAKLATGGAELRILRRAWDAAIWPHATAGFFKVKDQIPKVLRDLGLT